MWLVDQLIRDGFTFTDFGFFFSEVCLQVKNGTLHPKNTSLCGRRQSKEICLVALCVVAWWPVIAFSFFLTVVLLNNNHQESFLLPGSFLIKFSPFPLTKN